MSLFYYIKVQGGLVFEGTTKEFQTKFYLYPEDWTEEQKIVHISKWAQTNKWDFEASWLH